MTWLILANRATRAWMWTSSTALFCQVFEVWQLQLFLSLLHSFLQFKRETGQQEFLDVLKTSSHVCGRLDCSPLVWISWLFLTFFQVFLVFSVHFAHFLVFLGAWVKIVVYQSVLALYLPCVLSWELKMEFRFLIHFIKYLSNLNFQHI